MAVDVTLRAASDADVEVFFEQQRDPDSVRMVAFGNRDPNDRDVFTAHWAKVSADPNVTIRTIVYGGQVAGNVGSFLNGDRREVCYVLGKAFWGKGIATAALRLLLEEIGVRPLYAAVAGDNVGSVRVLEKCGFEHVERVSSFAPARGEEIEELILRLT